MPIRILLLIALSAQFAFAEGGANWRIGVSVEIDNTTVRGIIERSWNGGYVLEVVPPAEASIPLSDDASTNPYAPPNSAPAKTEPPPTGRRYRIPPQYDRQLYYLTEKVDASLPVEILLQGDDYFGTLYGKIEKIAVRIKKGRWGKTAVEKIEVSVGKIIGSDRDVPTDIPVSGLDLASIPPRGKNGSLGPADLVWQNAGPLRAAFRFWYEPATTRQKVWDGYENSKSCQASFQRLIRRSEAPILEFY